MRSLVSVGALVAVGLLASSSANAMQCQSTGNGYTRTWDVSPAVDCGTGPGNPNSSADIEAALGISVSDYTFLGDIKSTGDTIAALNVTVTPGWGGNNASGTWTLLQSFWFTYGEAVISIHVGGNPQNLPDDFAAFVITPKSLTGSWSYLQNPVTGGGGGLSNFMLWGRGPAACQPGQPCDPPDDKLPEPGTLALLGLGLLGIGASRRRAK